MIIAGGHKENFTEHDKIIEKILESESRELEAYENFEKKYKYTDINKKVIPKFLGSFKKGEKTIIKLENLKSHFKKGPLSIIDLKMMTAKMRREYGDIYKVNGFRVAGLVQGEVVIHGVGVKKSDTTHSFITKNFNMMTAHLTDKKGILHTELATDIIKQLEYCKLFAEKEPIYNSSILILTDYSKVVCRIIDFGHYRKKKLSGGIDPDKVIDKIISYYNCISKISN